jgi:hypothetical protein
MKMIYNYNTKNCATKDMWVVHNMRANGTFPPKENCSPQAIQPLKPFFFFYFYWGLIYGSFQSLLWMANEFLSINNVIPKVKTKYHECNKCEHESSNCMKTYRSPQKLILQDIM